MEEKRYMDLHEKYGDIGSAAYKRWESKYKQIQKEIKFGNKKQDNAFSDLKKEINSDVNRYIAEHGKRKKRAGISPILLPISLIIVPPIGDMVGAWALLLPIAAIGLPVLWISSIKDYKKAVIAASDFDEQYFGGEVFYKKKNGIPL